jgi:phage/plasmid-associated DNA primase
MSKTKSPKSTVMIETFSDTTTETTSDKIEAIKIKTKLELQELKLKEKQELKIKQNKEKQELKLKEQLLKQEFKKQALLNDTYGGAKDDIDACDIILKHYPQWVNCDNQLYVFNPETWMWDNSQTTHLMIIQKYNQYLYLLHAEIMHDGTIVYTKDPSKSYGNNYILMKKLPELIKTKCEQNNNWLKEKQNSSLGYILFNNGYYDFKNNRFIDKSNAFNGDIVFFGKIHHSYNIKTSKEEKKLMSYLKATFFTTPLGEDVGNYLLKLLARGLKGDVMKLMPFMLGPSNAGKSVLCTLLLASLGDYTGSFNAENLLYRQTNGDEAQMMRWLFKLRNKRIIYSNEMKSGEKLNGNMIKKVASGGDTLIGRGMFKEESEFVFHGLTLPFANDLNEIVPYDDAVNNRVQCIGFTKIYVDKPVEELNAYQLKMDDNIKDQIQQLPIQQAFVKLLIESYQDYLNTGFIIPEEVKQSKNDWVGNEKSVVELFLESFKITDEKHPDIKKNYNEDMHFVKSSDIDTWLKEYKKDYSMKRFSIDLKRHCALKGLGYVANKDKKINGKVNKCWFGIKEIEEDSDDEEEDD